MKKISTQVELLETIRNLVSETVKADVLSKEEQNMIIQYLRYEENWSQFKIGQLVNLATDTIRSRLKKINEHHRQTLISRGIDALSIFTELVRVKNIVQQKAAEKKDWGLVWRCEVEMLDKLIRMGLLEQSEPDENINNKETQGLSAKELRFMYEKLQQEDGKDPMIIKED